VTSISPASGSTAGGTVVTIQGNYLYGATEVTFGGVDAAGYLNDDDSISVITPPEGPGTVPVVVTTPGGSTASLAADAFTFVGPTATAPPNPSPPATLPVTSPGTSTSTSTNGYWLDGSDGGIFTFGSAQFYGSTGSLKLQRPVVGIVPTADKGGYWLDASDGGVFAFGDSGFYGSVPGLGLHPAGSGEPHSLDAPIVGMVPSADGGGYFMVASDGGVFAFDAPFLGSTGAMNLNEPVVGMTVANNGSGYWLVASDGGIFSFNAPFWGSTGSIHLNKPVVGTATDIASDGYWFVASDGGIFAFNAPFYGSTGNIVLNGPIVGMESNTTGSGYRLVSADCGVFDFGTSNFYGAPMCAPPAPAAPAAAPAPAPAGAHCQASAVPANDGYAGDYNVNVTSNQPNQTATASDATDTYSYPTNADGSATVFLWYTHPGEFISVTVGAASCSTTAQ